MDEKQSTAFLDDDLEPDVLTDIYLGTGDSAVTVVSRKVQVHVFLHLDGESVGALRLVVQSLKIPERGKMGFSPKHQNTFVICKTLRPSTDK